MVKNYEIYFILNPELDAKSRQDEINKVEKMVSADLKAENIKVESEGLKKLAYPINGHRSGFYASMTFDVDYDNSPNMHLVEKKLNIQDGVIRYIVVNQTEFLAQKAKETLNKTEISDHRDLNKGRGNKKVCLSKHLGLRVVDFKNTEYLEQFMSPYAKIFDRTRTGTSAKFQRKITNAIKRARHMALLPFTPIHAE